MTSDIIHGSPRGGRWQPIVRRGGMPLRVAVYSEIARAIRAGELRPGEVLPREADLCDALEVSRTVMREALILLEEDGLVRTQRGVGRFVADVLPAIGLERLQPIEQMLARPDRVIAVRRLRDEVEDPTDFTRRGLGLEAGDVDVRFWESVVSHDGEPVALAQEWIVAAPASGSAARAARAADQGEHADSSLLGALMTTLGPALGPAVCEVAVSTAGEERAHMLEMTGADPILVLNQTVSADARPLYLAKNLIRPQAAHLTVVQSSQS